MRAVVLLSVSILVLAAAADANPPAKPGHAVPISGAQQSSVMSTAAAVSRPDYGRVMTDLATAEAGFIGVTTPSYAGAVSEGEANVHMAEDRVRAIAAADGVTLPAPAPGGATIAQGRQALGDAAGQLARGDSNTAVQQDLAVARGKVSQAQTDAKEASGL